MRPIRFLNNKVTFYGQLYTGIAMVITRINAFRKDIPFFFALLVVMALSSCRQEKLQREENAPSTTGKTHEGHRSLTRSYRYQGFYQEYQIEYPVGKNNAQNDVHSIAVDNSSNIWVATAAGVFFKKKEGRNWSGVMQEHDSGPAFAVLADTANTVWMGTWNGLYRYNNGQLIKYSEIGSPVSTLCFADEGIYALGPAGIWLYDGNQWTKKDYEIARSVRDAVSDNKGGLWVATDVGLYHCRDSKTTLYQNEDELISCSLQGLAFGPLGRLWAGGLGGVTIREKKKKVKTLKPKDGLPSVFVKSITLSPDGVMWIGTDVGVVRFAGDGSHSLRFTRRWLLDDHVRDVRFDREGTAWIATAKGVSAIRKKPMTLKEKADYFYGVLMRRHIRPPWIAGQCRLKIPGDTASWTREDDDNDGQYTAMYLAMESLRFAATGDEDAHEKANKAFEFLKYLREVTDTEGFIARTIVPLKWSEMHDKNRTFTPEQIAEEQIKDPRYKPVGERWRRSKDGRWWWKGDTSSDELTGHMFGYFFYDLLSANENEKAVLADHVKKIMDYLIANDYNLVDIDGSHTHWGVWSPDKLNHDPDWAPERGINSLELLSFLKLTYHLTGDEEYQKRYLNLIREYQYMKNAHRILHSNPAWATYIDPELIFLAYPPLIMYETDEKIKLEWEQLLDKWYEGLKKDHSPFYNMMYSFLRKQKSEVDNSIAFLKDTPLSLVDWRIDQTKREDVVIVRRPILEDLQTSVLQPPSLRPVVRWDKNPWSAIGGNPAREREPVFWLLPYWLGKYIQIIK